MIVSSNPMSLIETYTHSRTLASTMVESDIDLAWSGICWNMCCGSSDLSRPFLYIQSSLLHLWRLDHRFWGLC